MSPLADANRVQIAYILEDTFGVQKTGSNLQILRQTGESLKQDTEINESQEIRSDRQISDIARVGLGASGGIDFEFSYGTFDDWLLAALMEDSTWPSETTIIASDTVTFDETGGVYTITIDAGTWTATPTVNEWIRVSGSVNNDGYYKVTVATTTVITVAQPLVDEVSVSNVEIVEGGSITNGTTKKSFNIERKYADLSNEFSIFLGMMVNELTLNSAIASRATGSFGFLGTKETSDTSSGGSGYDAATTVYTMNCVDHILAVYEAASAVDVTNVSFTLNNNLRGRQKLGTLGNFDIGLGTVSITGTLSAYFQSKTLFDKYLNFGSTNIAQVFQDTAGNSYIIELPEIKFTDGTRVAGGINTDVMAEMSFSAFKDPTENITIRIVQFAA